MTNHNNPYPHLVPKQAKKTIFLKHFIHNPNIYSRRLHLLLIIGKFCAIAMGTSIVLLSVILQR